MGPLTDWYHLGKDVDLAKTSTYLLPFQAGFQQDGNLDNHTLSLNATHTSQALTALQEEYNVHNLYGLMQSKAVAAFWSEPAQGPKKRPFVLSRSTFPSSGMYAGHSLGYAERTWDALRYSIAGIMNMNMFGIPLAGADVCGNTDVTSTPPVTELDEELCARWIQLSAFYPLARGYYFTGATASEPYALTTPKYKAMAKAALWQRTEIARYMYTEMARIHMNGGTLVKPMFFLYPEDPAAHMDNEQTFMVGNAIKVSPVVYKTTESDF